MTDIEFVSVSSDDPIVDGAVLARSIVAAMPTRLPFALDAPTLALLVLLAEKRATTFGEVVRALGAPLASVHAWIERAEAAGIVRRTKEVERADRSKKRGDNLDGKKTIVTLTRKGKAWIARRRC